jgi:hypothetical protein
MQEGLYLGAPPVRVWQAGARRLAFSLMRGVSAYDQSAGGFPVAPLAMPQIQRFRAPATANRDVELVELYAMNPGLFKQRLEAQFAPPRARVKWGLNPIAPQVGGS